MDKVREEAIKRSESWRYCDNVVNHRGQVGLLRMEFPRVFVLIRNDEQLFCSFDEFKDSVTEVNFLDPNDREGADIDDILTDAWNFLSLQEEEDERICEEYEEEDI